MKKTVKFRCINIFRGSTCIDIFVQVRKWYGWRTLKTPEEYITMEEWEPTMIPVSFINLNSFEYYRKIKEQFPYKPNDILLIEYPALTQYWPY